MMNDSRHPELLDEQTPDEGSPSQRHAAPARAPQDHRGASGGDSEATETKPHDQELGRGRSGIVYRSQDAHGHDIARKVFATSGLSKLVQYTLLGAPNPYIWCEPAIRSAVLRRRILAELVQVWFGSKLSVARAYGHAWNTGARAFEMRCELIHGRHVALRGPFSDATAHELHDVARNVMPILQDRLRASGFDGLVWQAGLGNPVALNNFMRDDTAENGKTRWVWIDLESGVPALFPINPFKLLGFYLPKSFKHRGPLFDDVDTTKLNDYVAKNRTDLERKIGIAPFAKLEANVRELAACQTEWKSLSRHQQSVSHRRATGSISHEQAEWYLQHPLHWYAREATRGARKILPALARCAGVLVKAAAKFNPSKMVKPCLAFVSSQQYRVELSRKYVSARINDWRDRGQISTDDAITLGSHLRTEEAVSYVTDFGVHLAVKPFVKVVQWWILPALWVAGSIESATLAILMLAMGPIVRSTYTLGRIIQNSMMGRERPWVALIAGMIPSIGTLAYPIQILASGAQAQADLARFILYDAFARMGRWVPIWGGRDTHTEHWMNRRPEVVFTRLGFGSSTTEDGPTGTATEALSKSP